MGEKYPDAHGKANKAFDYFTEVWKETFPNSKAIARSKIDERKERAKVLKELEVKMKEMTPEELEAYWEAIPEWKRGALVIQNATEEEQKEIESIFKRLRGKIGNRIKDTTLVKEMMEKEGENIKWARKEYQAFKGDAYEQIETSHNPIIRGTS